jgi:hypothetical protein
MTTEDQENKGIKSDLTIGYYDKSKFKGDLTWHPVKYKYMYGIKLDDIKYKGKRLNICDSLPKKSQCLITVDSGTSLMSVPT